MITLSRRGVFAYSEENVRTTALKSSSGPAIESRLASLDLLVTIKSGRTLVGINEGQLAFVPVEDWLQVFYLILK
jgi:predicted ThiF/HesA family dinucleotide-utilizing enzyme